MNFNRLSTKRLCLLTGVGALGSMAVITAVLYFTVNNEIILWTGMALTVCALFWMALLVYFFERYLSLFATDLCQRLNHMIDGEEGSGFVEYQDTLLARIAHNLTRLYEIMRQTRRKADNERQELQSLISDISHQIKNPIGNLKIVTDTLLTKPVGGEELTDFLQGMKNQVEKLDFLFQAMMKTSQMETGMIRLSKKSACLYNTLAKALSGIVYEAEKKNIEVTVSCPEYLRLPHDSKWTAEALFNLLDNAVKYTPEGGKISVLAEEWEMHVKIDVKDTGKGISESSHAAVFRRFYREEDVHGKPGVGIGLYLAREIVTRQGGYIKVISEPEKGSVFSVFLPKR